MSASFKQRFEASRNRRFKRRFGLLIAIFAVLTLGGCIFGGGQDEDEPVAGAWTLRPFELPANPTLRVVVEPQESVSVESRYEITALACDAVPMSTISPVCDRNIDRLQGDEDASSLTSSGTLVVTLQRKIAIDFRANGAPGEIQHIDVESVETPIGPLAFGESETLGPFSFDLEHLGYPHAPGPSSDDYLIVAQVNGCRLSNGSACGNLDRRIGILLLSPEEEAAIAGGTGSSSEGLTAEPTPTPVATATPTPRTGAAGAQTQGVNTTGRRLELVPNPNGVVVDRDNSMIELGTSSSGEIVGTLSIAWWFESSPGTVFMTRGTMTGTRTINVLTGEFVLDDPSANFLAFSLGGDSGTGRWGGTVLGKANLGDWVDGSLLTADGAGALSFELGVE